MKYQALVLVIAILFSTFMLRSFSASREASVHAPISETIHSVDAYVVPTLSSQKNKFQLPVSQGLVLSLEQKDMVTSSVDTVAVAEKPSVNTVASLCGVTAAAYLVKDITHESTLISKNEDSLRPIASVTKLMTVVIARELLSPTATTTITREIHDRADGYSSLEVGAVFNVQDLMRAALVVSSNDAAYALADMFGYDAFITNMNEKAKSLGMNQTHFSEPSGLSYLNQSTASDIAILLAYIYKTHSEILAVTREKSVSIVDQLHHRTFTLSNIDYFAGTKAFIGGKTGFINESGGNLVTLFNHDSSVWAVEVLGSDDRFADIRSLLTCVQKTLKP